MYDFIPLCYDIFRSRWNSRIMYKLLTHYRLSNMSSYILPYMHSVIFLWEIGHDINLRPHNMRVHKEIIGLLLKHLPDLFSCLCSLTCPLSLKSGRCYKNNTIISLWACMLSWLWISRKNVLDVYIGEHRMVFCSNDSE